MRLQIKNEAIATVALLIELPSFVSPHVTQSRSILKKVCPNKLKVQILLVCSYD